MSQEPELEWSKPKVIKMKQQVKGEKLSKGNFRIKNRKMQRNSVNLNSLFIDNEMQKSKDFTEKGIIRNPSLEKISKHQKLNSIYTDKKISLTGVNSAKSLEVYSIHGRVSHVRTNVPKQKLDLISRETISVINDNLTRAPLVGNCKICG